MNPITRALAITLILAPLAVAAQDNPIPAIEPVPQIAVPQSATPGDPVEGEADFRRCTACHAIGENAANRMGPQLNDVVGQPAATRDGFSYSQVLMKMRDEGLVWTPETLSAFLLDPRHFAPGTKMAFAGVKDETMRNNIIAYMATFSPDWKSAAESPPPSTN
jgi:cytochrome c